MRLLRVIVLLAAAGLTLACGNSNSPSASTSSSSSPKLPIVAVPGYRVSVFTQPTSQLVVSNPDAVDVDQGHVFIAYQNNTAKDCTDHNTSTVVEYDMQGKVLRHWDVPGHVDGMRVNPTTHLVWATSCEDGNPKFATIDPSSAQITSYTFPSPTPHGGGYDDLYFLNGTAYVAASNPTLTSSGSNPNPAVDSMTLGNGTIKLTPVLPGDVTAKDMLNNNAPTKITLTDPDSLSADNQGDLVLVSQADSVLVFIKNPGTSQQQVSKMTVGTQLEDTVWPTGSGRLLVVDGKSGTTYWISGHFSSGDIYTEAPSDSGVDNFVALIDPTTGFETPIAIGFTHATGLLWVPSS